MKQDVRFLTLALSIAIGSSAAAQDGTISGKVLDADKRPVAGALVVVCDQRTGIPIERETFQIFTRNIRSRNFVSAVSDEEGMFSVEQVKPGDYRLIAQSWEDARAPVTQAFQVNGSVIHLRGIAERVTVPSEEAARVSLRPLGDASLDVTTDPKSGNNATLLVVSRAPLAADPILGFSAWAGEFMPNMIAGNLMPLGKTTIHGLPAETVHIALFASDNNPGSGGVSVELEANETTTVAVPLIASWSDGHTTPPDRLKTLVEQVQKMDAGAVNKLIGQQHPDIFKALNAMADGPEKLLATWIPYLERPLQLDEGQRVPLKDLVAADAYVRLAAAAKRRAGQQAQMKQPDVDPTATYAETLETLHTTLGRTYPCFELKGIDWDAVGSQLLPRSAEVQDDSEFGLLCLEMVAALKDSHAQLLPGSAQLPQVPFRLWDAGFACLVDDRERPVVYDITPGGSAEWAGLKVGMTVTAVNGVPAQEAIQQFIQHQTRYVGYSSERYLRYHAYRFFARQMNEGEEFELTVIDLDGAERTFALQANQRAGYIPRLPVPIEGIDDSADVGWKMLDGNIGYIYVRRIRGDLIESLDAAVADLNSASGLIVDVRGNSGGGFDASRSHRNFDPEDPGEPNRPRYAGNIALLIDARCISAGEGWASWFVARERAKLFGEATAGASARKTVYTLKNGLYRVRYPVKAYTGFLDRTIEHRGLEPDVALMQNGADLAGGRDTVLEAAKAYLLEAGPD